MNSRRGERALWMFSFFILLFTGLLAYQLLAQTIKNKQLLTSTSEASQPEKADTLGDLKACPFSVQVYVDEMDENGAQSPLRLSEEQTQEWGFVDSLQKNLETKEIIRFNHQDEALYSIYNQNLSFSMPANILNTYINDTYTDLTLLYPKNEYEIVQKEVAACNSIGKTKWLCQNDTSKDLSTITGIFAGCDTEINLGWVVKKKAHSGDETAHIDTKIKPLVPELSDINGDGTTNTFDLFEVINAYGQSGPDIAADANKDGHVDALDYTIIITSFTAQSAN